MKKWKLLTERNLQTSLTHDQILNILLTNKGLTDGEEIKQYLFPSIDKLSYDAVGLDRTQMDTAVERIKKAIKTKESVVVYTDYDVDGVSGGTIMWETLYGLGVNAIPYIPQRVEEGYGLSIKGIDKIKKEHNVSLIVTVDHGIVAAEKIAYAKSLGIETMVFDHHVLPETLPDVVATVHTTMLCAGGIAWFFSNYLKAKIAGRDPDILSEDNIELAALATIADLIPLVGQNRILASLGLAAMRKTKRLGLNALIEESGLKKHELDVYDISHVISPRINAMGRLTHALDALRLLCTKDPERAHALATQLSTINRERQVLTQDSTVHALDLVKDVETSVRLLFVSHESYNQGVIGLIAGRLAQTYNLPAIVLAEGEEFSKASARSITGFNIVETIRRAADLLVDVGGHPMAAGFTVATKNIPALKQRLLEFAAAEITDEMMIRIVKIDLPLQIQEVTKDMYKIVQKLSPFGVGNTQPVFASYDVEVVKIQTVGKEGKHLKMVLKTGGSPIDAIGFGLGEYMSKIHHGDYIDVAYTIDVDNWNNQSRLQLKLVDVKINEE
jgi:single-stranded-DNA-specific exonuclease